MRCLAGRKRLGESARRWRAGPRQRGEAGAERARRQTAGGAWRPGQRSGAAGHVRRVPGSALAGESGAPKSGLAGPQFFDDNSDQDHQKWRDEEEGGAARQRAGRPPSGARTAARGHRQGARRQRRQAQAAGGRSRPRKRRRGSPAPWMFDDGRPARQSAPRHHGFREQGRLLRHPSRSQEGRRALRRLQAGGGRAVAGIPAEVQG